MLRPVGRAIPSLGRALAASGAGRTGNANAMWRPAACVSSVRHYARPLPGDELLHVPKIFKDHTERTLYPEIPSEVPTEGKRSEIEGIEPIAQSARHGPNLTIICSLNCKSCPRRVHWRPRCGVVHDELRPAAPRCPRSVAPGAGARRRAGAYGTWPMSIAS